MDLTTTSFVALLQNLRTASSFEDAAKAVLRAMLDFAADSFAQTADAQRPNVLRAVVHLRHDDGYQRLFGIDYATREELEGTGYLTSTRVWEWVTEHRCAVSLISGPTGVGKSRIARWCHEHSSRHDRRFETLDLSTVPEDLQLAELFGWKRGAFTGAVKDAPGAISRAAGGTLFLDEIQNLSSKAQAGLLRVLEERSYRPLGDEAGDKLADVRFIVGTNADLKAAVRAGKFREDLYYRVHVLPVRLPPLSERLDEVPLWAEYMLTRRHREGDARGAARFDREALQSLSGCSWPGNLRQLDNLVRRVYALALWERREGSGDVVVGKRHVDRALQYDGETQGGALVASFWLAAKRFVQEAQRREEESKPKLTLEMMDVIRGMGLGAAVLHCGDRDAAFRLLGQEQMLKTRNHHRAYRREIERVNEFVKLVGGDVEDDLNALLNAPEDHG